MALRKPRALVAGNWKMNGLKGSRKEITELARLMGRADAKPACEVMICPPSPLIMHMREAAKGTPIKIGAQDCHANASGAHTGDVSAAMLKDTGARAVIVGHSERRADHGENDSDVRAKADAAITEGMVAIICVGETAEQRQNGATLRIVGAQLKGSLPVTASAANVVIAYEPVWAIGSGLTPTVADVAKVHGHIRKRLMASLGESEAAKVRILYGGSVKPSNAAELMGIDNVNGALVGGASLKAADFFGIISAYL
jgi:triosephosphate isomerase